MPRILLAVILLSCGTAAGLVLAGRLKSDEAALARPATAEAPPAAAAQGSRAGTPPDFSPIAERTVGGVTNISSVQPVQRPAFADDPFFRYFSGEDDYFGWERRPQSLGSGVIVTSDGYVLTNTHVVGDPRAEVTVVLGDKREMGARIVGIDPLTDIALLKIDGRNLPAIPWGDSSKLKIAEWVLAIGNPYQLNQTVTLGIVSAVGRSLQGRVAGYEDFIQTDAAINPGNSGGALINSRGELVGINTAIFSQSGGYQGIGFAVPSNLAHRIMDDLRRYGDVRRGSIGLGEVVPVTTQMARQLDVPSSTGALVYSMLRNSPAWEAGIRPGDVIVSFNGQPVEDASHLLRLLADAPIGSTITLGVIQNGRRRDIPVRVVQQDRSRRRAL
jgi:Do/DeqQ family serine protease